MFGLTLCACLLLSANPERSTKACAHRGDSKAAPENTLPAIASAVKKGAPQIEFDVHLTRDGKLVIIHDATVNRTTNGKGTVSEMTFEEIRKLDAGSWFSPQFAGTRIPTLEEVIDAIPRATWANVHLKNAPGVAKAAAKVLREKDRLDHCFLACTKEQAVEAKSVAPGIKICNMSRQIGFPGRYVPETIAAKAEFIQLHAGSWLGTLPDNVAELHRHGVTVNYFGAQEEKLIKKLAAAGVDYILTDDLDLCQRVLAESERDRNVDVK
ncbi:MAG: glycerophosphodiester phosphodiesterase family protein [Planctomycetota bacterium]